MSKRNISIQGIWLLGGFSLVSRGLHLILHDCLLEFVKISWTPISQRHLYIRFCHYSIPRVIYTTANFSPVYRPVRSYSKAIFTWLNMEVRLVRIQFVKCFAFSLSLSLREIMQETPHLTTFYLNLICKRFLVYYSSYRLKVSLKLKN